MERASGDTRTTSVEILKKEGVEDPVLFDAICAHNPESGVKAKTKLQYAILGL